MYGHNDYERITLILYVDINDELFFLPCIMCIPCVYLFLCQIAVMDVV